MDENKRTHIITVYDRRPLQDFVGAIIQIRMPNPAISRRVGRQSAHPYNDTSSLILEAQQCWSSSSV
jgi:hypothetical protein